MLCQSAREALRILDKLIMMIKLIIKTVVSTIFKEFTTMKVAKAK